MLDHSHRKAGLSNCCSKGCVTHVAFSIAPLAAPDLIPRLGFWLTGCGARVVGNGNRFATFRHNLPLERACNHRRKPTCAASLHVCSRLLARLVSCLVVLVPPLRFASIADCVFDPDFTFRTLMSCLLSLFDRSGELRSDDSRLGAGCVTLQRARAVFLLAQRHQLPEVRFEWLGFPCAFLSCS